MVKHKQQEKGAGGSDNVVGLHQAGTSQINDMHITIVALNGGRHSTYMNHHASHLLHPDTHKYLHKGNVKSHY